MADKHRFALGLIEGGRYAAASTKAPYFFFVGDTKEEVEETAKRALDFYFGTTGVLDDAAAPAPSERSGIRSRFRPLVHVAAA